MAKTNKTIAWETVKWIKARLPLWESRGIPKKFLESLIVPSRYKKVSADVESLLTCDIFNFEVIYNQEDTIPQLKALCKKYRLPYGKVSVEAELKAEKEADIIFPEFERVKPKRLEKGRKEEGVSNVKKHLIKEGYTIVNEVENKEEIRDLIINKRKTVPQNEGYRTLRTDPDLLELLIDLAQQKTEPREQERLLNLKWVSIPKYHRMLQWVNVLQKDKLKRETYVVNEDVVKFKGGRISPTITFDLFGED